MDLPEVVTAEKWEAARAGLLVTEKAATHALDALAAERRRLPMVRFDGDYAFEGRDGPARLIDLFDGRRQLVVYQFMDVGPGELCPGCKGYTDNSHTAAASSYLEHPDADPKSSPSFTITRTGR